MIQPAELLDKPLLKKRHDNEAASEGERARLEEEQQELAQDRARSSGRQLRKNGCYGYRERWWRSLEQAAVVQNADDASANEQQRHFGLQDDGDDEADRRDRPLQPVFHAKLGQAVAGMQDQRDDCGTYPIKDRGYRLQVAEIDIESA